MILDNIDLDDSYHLDNIDDQDTDIGCKTCYLLPDEINDLGAHIPTLENYLVDKFVSGGDLSLINNSTFKVEMFMNEFDEEEMTIFLLLENG